MPLPVLVKMKKAEAPEQLGSAASDISGNHGAVVDATSVCRLSDDESRKEETNTAGKATFAFLGSIRLVKKEKEGIHKSRIDTMNVKVTPATHDQCNATETPLVGMHADGSPNAEERESMKHEKAITATNVTQNGHGGKIACSATKPPATVNRSVNSALPSVQGLPNPKRKAEASTNENPKKDQGDRNKVRSELNEELLDAIVNEFRLEAKRFLEIGQDVPHGLLPHLMEELKTDYGCGDGVITEKMVLFRCLAKNSEERTGCTADEKVKDSESNAIVALLLSHDLNQKTTSINNAKRNGFSRVGVQNWESNGHAPDTVTAMKCNPTTALQNELGGIDRPRKRGPHDRLVADRDKKRTRSNAATFQSWDKRVSFGFPPFLLCPCKMKRNSAASSKQSKPLDDNKLQEDAMPHRRRLTGDSSEPNPDATDNCSGEDSARRLNRGVNPTPRTTPLPCPSYAIDAPLREMVAKLLENGKAATPQKGLKWAHFLLEELDLEAKVFSHVLLNNPQKGYRKFSSANELKAYLSQHSLGLLTEDWWCFFLIRNADFFFSIRSQNKM